MKHRTFFWFFLPTGLAMLLFIAAPILSVVTQSMFAPHEAVLVTVENCGPFGCKQETTIDQDATRALRDAHPMGRFVGLDVYLDRGHLAFSEVAEAWAMTGNWGDFLSKLRNLPFYRAMAFTLTFTFLVTPLLIIFGLTIALAVNSLHQRLKGLVIFFSLLPMIVTPLIGSLILFWMIDAQGVLGSTLQRLTGDASLSLKASFGSSVATMPARVGNAQSSSSMTTPLSASSAGVISSSCKITGWSFPSICPEAIRKAS